MKSYSSKELRSLFLKFFQDHGHAVISSASVIPENDPTVLFTTAGMHPLVPYLMGEKHPMGTRLTDVQKCIRTGDIEDVGDFSHLRDLGAGHHDTLDVGVVNHIHHPDQPEKVQHRRTAKEIQAFQNIKFFRRHEAKYPAKDQYKATPQQLYDIPFSHW